MFAYGKGYRIAIETLLGFENHFLKVHDLGWIAMAFD